MTTIALCRVIKLQEKSWGRGSLIGYFHELSQAVLKSFIYLYAKKKSLEMSRLFSHYHSSEKYGIPHFSFFSNHFEECNFSAISSLRSFFFVSFSFNSFLR